MPVVLTTSPKFRPLSIRADSFTRSVTTDYVPSDNRSVTPVYVPAIKCKTPPATPRSDSHIPFNKQKAPLSPSQTTNKQPCDLKKNDTKTKKEKEIKKSNGRNKAHKTSKPTKQTKMNNVFNQANL